MSRVKVACSFMIDTRPEVEPVTVEQLRAQVRTTSTAEDDLLKAYLAAARGWVEGYTGRALMKQSWLMTQACFADKTWLPRATPIFDENGPLVVITYYDLDNTLQTLDASVYLVLDSEEPCAITLAPYQVWPLTACRDDAVQINYSCGSDDPALIEPQLLQAIRAMAAAMFERDGDMGDPKTPGTVAFAAEAACAHHRVFWKEPFLEVA